MKKSELRAIINEEIQSVLNEVHGLGAFRRLVITSAKFEAIKTEIEKFMKRPEIKRDYPVKLTIKNSLLPNSFVIDMEGDGATALGNKLKDQAKKLDKLATVKVKTEAPKKAVKEISVTTGEHMPTSSGADFTVDILTYEVGKKCMSNSLYKSLQNFDTRTWTDDGRKFNQTYPTARSIVNELKNVTEIAKKNSLLVLRADDGEWSTYILIKLTNPGSECVIGAIKTTKVKAKMAYSPNVKYQIEGTVRQIHVSELDKNYIGKGLGNFLYHCVWDDSSAILSDSILFKGSFAMWSGKIASEAEFFGGEIKSNRTWDASGLGFVIPLNIKDAANLTIAEDINRYIAIKSDTPKVLRLLKYNLQKLNPLTEVLYIADENIRLNNTFDYFENDTDDEKPVQASIIDVIEQSDNLVDFLDTVLQRNVKLVNTNINFYKLFPKGGINEKKIRSVILMVRDATLIVKETSGGNLTYNLL